jgi:hypothetical protein
MTKSKIDLKTVADEATEAFWQVVVKHFPSATSGDLSPLTTARLHLAAEEAVAEWVWANVPAKDRAIAVGRVTRPADLKEASMINQPNLPPDPEGMNEKRAFWAAQAIEVFQETTGCDDEGSLCDLLADLMHWANRAGYDFVAALDRACDHYEAETMGEPV